MSREEMEAPQSASHFLSALTTGMLRQNSLQHGAPRPSHNAVSPSALFLVRVVSESGKETQKNAAAGAGLER